MNVILLQKLITISSTYPHEGSLAKYIKTWAEKNANCTVEAQKVEKDRENLLLTKGNGTRTILLYGHLDTVPVAEGWKTDPFGPTVKGGKLFGLGAWDMKAGVYTLLETIKEFSPKNITLKVALAVDEENYSVGVHKLIDSGFCDGVDFVLVPEPGFVHGEKGVTIGRSGRATFNVEITGISAHGSFPEEGVNAIEQAMLFIKYISGLQLLSNKELGASSLFPRMINSEAKGFSVPDTCTIEIDSKLVAPDKPKDVLKKLKAVSTKLYKEKKLAFQPKVSFKQRPTPFCSPYEVDRNNEYVKICEKSVKHIAGKAVTFYRNSVADECVFAERLKVPVVTIGPAGGNAHTANEYVELDSLERLRKIYIDILEKIDSTS